MTSVSFSVVMVVLAVKAEENLVGQVKAGGSEAVSLTKVVKVQEEKKLLWLLENKTCIVGGRQEKQPEPTDGVKQNENWP